MAKSLLETASGPRETESRRAPLPDAAVGPGTSLERIQWSVAFAIRHHRRRRHRIPAATTEMCRSRSLALFRCLPERHHCGPFRQTAKTNGDSSLSASVLRAPAI